MGKTRWHLFVGCNDVEETWNLETDVSNHFRILISSILISRDFLKVGVFTEIGNSLHSRSLSWLMGGSDIVIFVLSRINRHHWTPYTDKDPPSKDPLWNPSTPILLGIGTIGVTIIIPDDD